MVSYQQKINIMRKEFAEIDLNHDELLTQQELYSYLDKKVSNSYTFIATRSLKSALNLSSVRIY
jgi:hypothetical protein